MDEPIRAFCRLGIVHFMAWPECIGGEGPIVETIAAIAADAEFEVAEVARINDPAVRQQVRAIADQAGLELAYAAQPAVLTAGLDPNSLDEKTRRQAVDALKSEIDLAYEMRAIGFAFLSGKDPGPARRPAAMQALLRSCNELCDHAGGLGSTPVLLESFDRDVDKRALVGPNALAAELAAKLDRDNFGLLIDLSHLPLQRESVEQALQVVQPYLRHAHMGNCLLSRSEDPAYGDQHPRFGYPDSEIGVAELARYLQGLMQVGYLDRQRRAVLSFEIRPAVGESTANIIANAKRSLARAWLQV